ncbi:Bgt-20887-2, partial [Blumeria graminis f. sp. tritici]
KDTASHLIDWYEVAQKTELSDDALRNHLYNSLHPTIVSHLQNCVILRRELPTDLSLYLIEVRHIDAVLCSSDP